MSEFLGDDRRPPQRAGDRRSPSARRPVRCSGADRPGERTADGAPRRPAWRAVRGAGARSRRRADHSSPEAAWRSSSGRSESSRTGAGNEPSTSPSSDHQVQIEADPHADRADEDAVTDAPDPSQIGLELELQRPGEHVEASPGPPRRPGRRGGRAHAPCARRPSARRGATGPAAAPTPSKSVEASAGPGTVLGPALGRARRRPGRRSDPARSHAAPGRARLPRACARPSTPGRPGSTAARRPRASQDSAKAESSRSHSPAAGDDARVT